MSLTRKRSRRDELDDESNPPTGRRLYLIFDDWAWGYSIYDLDLTSSSSSPAGAELEHHRLLPPPYIRVEAPRGSPWQFAPIGTKIVATHARDDSGEDSVPPGFQPILDVRSRAINFGPGQVIPHLPIFFPVGDDELYSLDTCGFKKLSLKPLWPPRLEPKYKRWFDVWSWEYLPEPPFDRYDVTSYAMDGKTLLVSTATATFAFDTGEDGRVWKPDDDDWSMPFAGRAHFVSSLDAFVGLSKDPDKLGHLCSCNVVDGSRSSCRFSKEKLFSEDPAEDHVGATLVYLGERSNEAEFCLVQCISIEDGNAAGQEQQLEVEKGDHVAVGSGDTGGSMADLEPLKKRKRVPPKWGEEMPRGTSYFYRLTTFSLGYDDSNGGGLTTGDSCRVQCYKVPETITQTSFLEDPVAFWL